MKKRLDVVLHERGLAETRSQAQALVLAGRVLGHSKPGEQVPEDVELLFLPGLGILTWKDAQSRIPWGTVVLFGIGISLGTALLQTKAFHKVPPSNERLHTGQARPTLARASGDRRHRPI